MTSTPQTITRPSGPAVLIALQGAAAMAAFTLVTALAVIALLPLALGWRSDVVVSGSMSPAVSVGDVVSLAEPTGQTTQGMIIAFNAPDQPELSMLHRVVGVDEAGVITTKGDANPTNDTQTITATDVDAMARLVVPAIGLPVQWLRTGNVLGLALLGGIVALGMLALSRNRRLVRWEELQADGEALIAASPASAEALNRHHGHRIAWAGTVVSSLVLVVGLAAMGIGAVHAGFSASTVNASSWGTASATTPYGLAVLADQPSLYLPLDDPAQTPAVLTDLSGNDTVASAVGSWNYSLAGPLVGQTTKAMSPASTSSSIAVTQPTTMPTNWSINLWFKTTGQGKLASWTDTAGSKNQVVTAYVDTSNRLRVAVRTSGGSTVTLTSSSSVTNDTWRQLTITSGIAPGATSASTILYLDGAKATSSTSVAGKVPTVDVRFGYSLDSKWSLPSEPTITGMQVGSRIGQISSYEKALTAQQVATLRTASGR